MEEKESEQGGGRGEILISWEVKSRFLVPGI